MWSRIKGSLEDSEYFSKLIDARISTKITAMYAAILFVVLLTMTVITGFGVYFAFYHQAEVELELSMRNVLDAVDRGEASDLEFWRGNPVLPGVVLRVTDASGRVLYENEDNYPSIEEVEATVKSHPPFWANRSMEVSEWHNLTIYHAEFTLVKDGAIYDIHFFRTITAERDFLRTLQRFLLVATLLGFILALCAGYFLSNRILRPIRTMTQTAKKIEVENMDSRITVPPTHDELAELADTFNHMLDRLQSGFAQQQRFVSDASHELRTPVTVILGYSDLLTRWGRQDADILDESILSIKSEAENMQQLIEKLLFLARADQKRQVLYMERIEFSDMLEDIVRKMKLVSKDHSVELLQNEEGMIFADPVTIRQMIRIFLDNAIKYTPKGGSVTLSSYRLHDGIFTEIVDTGVGISKEDQKKVFERFYRVDSSRTKSGGVSGTGLGLSIARWIAEQHNIEIRLLSEIGKGTRIQLKIPLALP